MMTTPYICTVASYFVFSLSHSTGFTTGHDATVLFMKKPRIQTELNKMKILRHCYRIMATGTWDAISVADLEAGMAKTRGAIFYFNKNKSELFINMIDELFLPIFKLNEQNKKCYLDCSSTLFFASYKNPFERVSNDLRINYNIPNPNRALFNIINQAQNQYPNFNKIIKHEIELEIIFIKNIIGSNETFELDLEGIYSKSIGKLFLSAII